MLELRLKEINKYIVLEEPSFEIRELQEYLDSQAAGTSDKFGVIRYLRDGDIVGLLDAGRRMYWDFQSISGIYSSLGRFNSICSGVFAYFDENGWTAYSK